MNGHLFQTSMDPSSMTHSNTSSSNNMLMRMMMENSEANANVKNNIINNNDINVTTYHNVINTSSMSLSPSSSSSTITNGLNSKGSSDHGNGGNIANISNGNNKNSYSGSLSNQNVQDKTIEVLSNHQQGSMPLGKVKRSCEECSRAKVKCSSSLPKCIRCNDRKITCVYVEEMRRGRRDILLRTSPSSDTRDIQAPDSLNITDLIKSSDSVSTPNTGCSSISTSSAKALNEITSATTTTISPTTFQLYRIVNGTPETVSRVLPVKVAQPKRDKSQTSKSFKAESLKKEKESKPSKKQKVASTDEKKKKDDNPNVNFVDSSRATPEQMDIQKTDNLAAVNNNNNINGNNMSKQELRMVEKKIFSIFCELSNHIKISSGTCVCGGFIPLSQQKMNHYLFMTDQLSHYMDLSKDIEQQIILMNPPSSSSSPSSSSAATSNSFQRLDISYTSLDELDIVNNIDDRFTVAPAMSPSQGLKFENSSYKAYIERLSNPSNPIPYYRLDCITSLVVDGQILSPSNQGRSISTVTPFINEAFSNTFGYSPALITWFHQHLQGGLLPFGGDILTLLMNDLKSIRRCLHRITVKTRHSLSMVQSQLIPNSSLCQTFETQFSIGNAENPLQLVHRNNKGSVINCICQILFRNVILPDMSSAGTQMHVSFVPVHIMSIPKEINTQTNQIQYPQSDMQTQPQGHNRNHNHAQIQSIPQQGIQIRQGYGHPPNTSNQVFMNNPQSNFPPYSGNQQQQMLNFQQQQIHNQQPGNHQQISQMHRNFKQGIPDSIPFTVLPNNHAMVNQTEALFKDDLIDQITSSSPAPFQSLFSPSSNPKLFQFDEA